MTLRAVPLTGRTRLLTHQVAKSLALQLAVGVGEHHHVAVDTFQRNVHGEILPIVLSDFYQS